MNRRGRCWCGACSLSALAIVFLGAFGIAVAPTESSSCKVTYCGCHLSLRGAHQWNRFFVDSIVHRDRRYLGFSNSMPTCWVMNETILDSGCPQRKWAIFVDRHENATTCFCQFPLPPLKWVTFTSRCASFGDHKSFYSLPSSRDPIYSIKSSRTTRSRLVGKRYRGGEGLSSGGSELGSVKSRTSWLCSDERQRPVRSAPERLELRSASSTCFRRDAATW